MASWWTGTNPRLRTCNVHQMDNVAIVSIYVSILLHSSDFIGERRMVSLGLPSLITSSRSVAARQIGARRPSAGPVSITFLCQVFNASHDQHLPLTLANANLEDDDDEEEDVAPIPALRPLHSSVPPPSLPPNPQPSCIMLHLPPPPLPPPPPPRPPPLRESITTGGTLPRTKPRIGQRERTSFPFLFSS